MAKYLCDERCSLEGSLLKVGLGESIRVLDDPWIVDADNTRIITPLIHGLEDIRVDNLFMIGEK